MSNRIARNVTRHALVETFLLSTGAGAPLKSGDPFKIASTQVDPNSDIIEVMPSLLATDPVHGIARPHERLGVQADSFVPGATFQGTLLARFICGVVLGATLTKGTEVTAGAGGAFIAAPPFVAGGAPLVTTAGILLRDGASGDASELMAFPRTYTTT